jgi:hypothetical protein
MSTTEMMERIAEASPRLQAKFVGVYYLITILTGAFILFFRGRSAIAADIVAAVFYLAVTALLYELSRLASRRKGR